MSTINFLPLRSTLIYTSPGVLAPVGSIYVVSTTGLQTLTSTITGGGASSASTMIYIGASTNSTYNNLSNGSYSTGWFSTLSGVTSTVNVSMTQNGTNILALRSYTSSISTSVNSGVSWSTLAGSGLPTGTPTYTTLAQSATGQYQLVAAGGLGLFYSANYGTTFTASVLNATIPYIYLSFDNSNITDVMGNVTPTLNGSVSYVQGQVGTNAVYFANTLGATSGLNYVTVPWSGTSTGAITCSSWIYVQSVSTNQENIIQTSSGYAGGFAIYITSTNNYFALYTPSASVNSNVAAVANTWYYVCAIFQSNSTMSFYINGALIGSTTHTGGTSQSAQNIIIGCNSGLTGVPFRGYIDDFRFYNAVVTSAVYPIPYFNNVAVSGTGQYMYATANNTGGLYYSSNYGISWTQLAASLIGAGSWSGLTLSKSGQYVAAETNYVSPQMSGISSSTWTAGGITWTVTASSSYDNNNLPYAVFYNSNVSASIGPPYEWSSLTNYTASGTYTANTASTTIQSGIGLIYGEWLQLQSSVPIIMNNYTFATNSYTGHPKSYYIVGSTDGSTWYPIQYASMTTNPFTANNQTAANYISVNQSGTQTITAGQIGSGTFTTYSTSLNAYSYFRIVIVTTFSTSATYTNIGRWFINFIGGHTTTTNYGSSWSLSPYPATTISPNSASATASSWTANGVTWTASVSSNYDANNPDYGAFNNVTGTGSSNNWSSINPSYNTTTGAYSASSVKTTTVLGGVGSLSGEWVQIQSSVPLVLYSYTYGGYFYLNVPKTYTIVGSTDGTNWYPLQACSMTTNPFTAVNQSATSYILMNQSGTQSIIGAQTGSGTFTAYPYTTQAFTYFRMICQTVYPSNTLGAVHIGEWYMNFLHPTALPSFISTSGNGQYTLVSNNRTLSLMSNYINSFTSYTVGTLSSINAPINCMSVSSTGQYMLVLTQGATNNVYYSTNYGATFTALTVGSSAMTSCAISYDGSYITVSNATTVYTLNTNTVGYSVTIGNQAGVTNQALNAIAIGNQAGFINQSANSVVLNANGSAMNAYYNGTFFGPVATTASSSQPVAGLLGYGADLQVTNTGVYAGSNGYVGIGTNFPTSALHIHNSNTGGSVLPYLHISGGGNSGNTVGINLSPWYTRPGGTPVQIIGLDDGSFSAHMLFLTAAAGSPGSTTPSERMRITSSGYVGIGTTSPGTFIDVQGYIQIGNGGSNSYDMINFTRGIASASYPNIQCQNNYMAMYSSGAGGWAYDSAVGDMIFRTPSNNFIWNNNAGGYSAMMLYSSPANILRIGPAYSTAGSVAIFSTTIPSSAGEYNTADGARIVFNNTYNGTAGTGMAANKIVLHNNNWIGGFGLEGGSVTYHTGTAHTFYINTNNASTYGSHALIINGSGNVGIGSSTPQTTLDVNGSTRANFTYNQTVSHTLVSGTNTNRWYKIASFSAAAYGEFLLTWNVSGEHGEVRFIASSLYNYAPTITVLSSSYYSGPAIQVIRIALDTSSIYNTHYIEYYTNSSFYSTVTLNCYLLSNSPNHSQFSLLALTAGTTSGFNYYNAWLTNAFQVSPNGNPIAVNYSGYLGIGTTNPLSIFNVIGGTTTLNSGTYNNPVEYVSPAPALHLRAGSGAVTQQVWECVNLNTCGIGCGGTAGLSYGVQAGSHIFRVGCTYNGDYTTSGSIAMIIGSSTGIGTTSPSAPFHSYLGGKIVIQNSQDGGTNRGIYYWYNDDSNWVGYMGQSGGGRSASGGTACTGAFGFTQHAIRNRVYTYSGSGFIWENSNETCLMSIRADGAGGGVIGQWGVNTLSPTRTLSVNGSLGVNGWYYVEGAQGIYWPSYSKGFASAESTGATWGSCIATGGGRNGWKGWGIGGNIACFMSNGDGAGTAFGIHDNYATWAFYVPSAGTRESWVMGSVRCSQYWDRLIVCNNGYDTSGGYFYSNQGGGYGMISDQRIKKHIESVPIDKSMTFVMNLQPSTYCLKQAPGDVPKHCDADGNEVGDFPVVCNCPQSGFIAQNVLAAAELANIPKSVCNDWYDYEQQLDKPDKERTAILGVSIVPIVAHTVNVIKHQVHEIEELSTTDMNALISQQADTIASLQQQISAMTATFNQFLQRTQVITV